MHRTLLSFITSIFLCAAFSSEAQERTDWALKAAEFERAAFDAEDPHDAAEALVSKAECYKQCGRYSDAVATLGRVGMYLLTPDRRADVIYEKELCSYLAGDFAGAASYMEEAGAETVPRRLLLDALVLGENARWDEARSAASALLALRYGGAELDAALLELDELFTRKPSLKTEKQAVFRSFLPPLGHAYSGHLPEGLLSMGLNATAAGWTVWQCVSGNWITGLLGGGIALSYTFMGGMARSAELAEQYNHDAMRGFNDAFRALLLQHAAAE
jgi:tetratricopeptide (TPR) repeat protein